MSALDLALSHAVQSQLECLLLGDTAKAPARESRQGPRERVREVESQLQSVYDQSLASLEAALADRQEQLKHATALVAQGKETLAALKSEAAAAALAAAAQRQELEGWVLNLQTLRQAESQRHENDRASLLAVAASRDAAVAGLCSLQRAFRELAAETAHLRQDAAAAFEAQCQSICQSRRQIAAAVNAPLPLRPTAVAASQTAPPPAVASTGTAARPLPPPPENLAPEVARLESALSRALERPKTADAATTPSNVAVADASLDAPSPARTAAAATWTDDAAQADRATSPRRSPSRASRGTSPVRDGAPDSALVRAKELAVAKAALLERRLEELHRSAGGRARRAPQASGDLHEQLQLLSVENASLKHALRRLRPSGAQTQLVQRDQVISRLTDECETLAHEVAVARRGGDAALAELRDRLEAQHEAQMHDVCASYDRALADVRGDADELRQQLASAISSLGDLARERMQLLALSNDLRAELGATRSVPVPAPAPAPASLTGGLVGAPAHAETRLGSTRAKAVAPKPKPKPLRPPPRARNWNETDTDFNRGA